MANLYAHEVIWRVIEVLAVTMTENGKMHILTGKVETRKTYDGAKQLRDRWATDNTRGAIIQGGIVTWYPDDELQTAYDSIDWMRTQNYDDRDET